jgi:predicted Zn-dependent peptidase
MWIDAGSRAETEETNGTAHFLEHLAFKVRTSSADARDSSQHIPGSSLIIVTSPTGYLEADAAAVGARD